ncbi:HAD family hydrolase [Roseburia sp. MSJ-14]|uniref:HAD family hydrolase n=1 Tax=Roseburia sp. MSJ-14 TaxID=2841514 RepID=UPI001C0F7F20|nr:HAD family phosphatase [Roseburia sp. MSJ-14]MBU5472785.1 HAD family phosphatase [Roseburia sp. MSJ-14]
MLKNIQAIIFDLDGTLIDSMWVWDEIDIEFLSARGLTLPPTYQKEIEGMSFTETAIYTKQLFQFPESVEELKTIWNQMALEKYTKEVPLKPGAEAFFKYCKSKKIPMGIATSNSRELVDAVANTHHLKDYIEVIVTSCEVAKGKPAPDVYLEVAKRLRVQPEHCLVFEDVPMGILAGKNAGMKVCAVKDACSEDQREEKRKYADYYISSYQEVLTNSYEVLEHE